MLTPEGRGTPSPSFIGPQCGQMTSRLPMNPTIIQSRWGERPREPPFDGLFVVRLASPERSWLHQTFLRGFAPFGIRHLKFEIPSAAHREIAGLVAVYAALGVPWFSSP